MSPMSNEIADAMRAELREALTRKYGDLEKAAVATGVPYKTLYRNLTEKGKDRNKTVTLDFVIDLLGHLGVEDFGTFYADAIRHHIN